MKIGVNLLLPGRNQTGLGTYAINLLNELAAHPEDEYVVFTAHREDIKGLTAGNIRFVDLPLKSGNRLRRLVAEQVALPRMASAEKLDLLFTPGFYMPLFCEIPQVVTIHDLIHKTWPQDMAMKNRILMTIFVDGSIRRAASVISVSESTRKDIERHVGRTEGVFTVYEGIGNSFDGTPGRPNFVSPVESFALAVGSIMPRKNILGIIRAFEMIGHETNLKLVVAGLKGYGYKAVKEHIDKNHLSEKVLLPGFLPDAELEWCYRHARMLLFCSFYEGFGFPPLEAMRVGTPVIASNVSSLPEILGDAALLVDPAKPGEIGEAIRKVAKDEALRKQLIGKGFKRTQNFTWTKAAQETRKVFEAALQTSHRGVKG